MRISVYDTRINAETGRHYLVKEKGVNCKEMPRMASAETAAAAINYLFDAENLADEHAYMICADQQGRVTGFFEISKGGPSSAYIDMSSIYGKALLIGASGILLAHNHPSGCPEPSQEDADVTERARKAGELLGVKLLDHIIIGRGSCYSFAYGRGFAPSSWGKKGGRENV